MSKALDQSKVDDVISKLGITPTSPGCSVAIARNGTIIYTRGYGMADLDHGIENTSATVFHAASLAKQFTAMAIMLLVNDKCISLDDNVHDHIEELGKLEPQVPRITIRQILHHTSGIRDQWALLTAAGWRLGDDVATRDDVMGLLRDMKTPNFNPDADWSYSNTNYFLAGLIVERTNKKSQSLADFAQENIFSKLGMTNTRFVETHGETVKHRAYGYRKIEQAHNVFRFEKTMPNYSLTGPTNLVTTVEDLIAWDRNFGSGTAAVTAAVTVGGEEAIDQMLQPCRTDGAFGYGFGLFVFPTDIANGEQPQIFYHDGVDPGHRAHLIRYEDEKLTIAFLCNLELQKDTLDVVNDIADAIRPQSTARSGARIKVPYGGTVSTPGLEEKKYAGRYRCDEIAAAYEVKLDEESGKLMLFRHRHPPMPLEPCGADEFRINGFAERTLTTVTVKFVPGSGNINGFLMSDCRGRLRNLPFSKVA